MKSLFVDRGMYQADGTALGVAGYLQSCHDLGPSLVIIPPCVDSHVQILHQHIWRRLALCRPVAAGAAPSGRSQHRPNREQMNSKQRHPEEQ